MRNATGLLWTLLLAVGAASGAGLEREEIGVEVLAEPSPHWLWISDGNIFGLNDTKAFLFDGDTGEMLGLVPTGVHSVGLVLAPDRSRLYSAETYYPRGTRGERGDWLIVRDMTTLGILEEIQIPPKRSTGTPYKAYQGISDDGRFVYVNNTTPATSTSVVDVEKRRFVAEIEKAGCNLIYPTGDRSFASLCANGTVQQVTLDDEGEEASRAASPEFFDPKGDPLREGGVRDGDVWYFVSFQGHVHPVEFAGGRIRPGTTWSLFSDAEREQGWKAGGTQLLALHRRTGELYVSVHQGEEWSHKEPGTQVWVYDLKSRRKQRTIELETPALSLAVSQDPSPLLYSAFPDTASVSIYDARKGELLRTIQGPAPVTPLLVYPLSQ